MHDILTFVLVGSGDNWGPYRSHQQIFRWSAIGEPWPTFAHICVQRVARRREWEGGSPQRRNDEHWCLHCLQESCHPGTSIARVGSERSSGEFSSCHMALPWTNRKQSGICLIIRGTKGMIPITRTNAHSSRQSLLIWADIRLSDSRTCIPRYGNVHETNLKSWIVRTCRAFL